MSAPLTEPSLRERSGDEPGAPISPALALVGSLLVGRYEIRAAIGRGGMGEVFEAVDRRLGRTVAIKVLRPELAADERFLARFRREAATAARLTHAGIVAVHDIGEDGGKTFIVMEFVAGRTLAEVARSRGTLGPDRIRSVGVAAARALAHAHERGIVHRDVSPANIMVTDDGAVKILDFGIARGGSAALRSNAASRGTLPYVAPEVLRGARVDARADVYALGAVLRELAVHVDDTRLREVLVRATAADPAHRIPSAATFADALGRPEGSIEPATARTMPLKGRTDGGTTPIVRLATRPLGSAPDVRAAPEPARGVAVTRARRRPRARRVTRAIVSGVLVATAVGGALVLGEVVTTVRAPQAAASVTGPAEVPAPGRLEAEASCDGLFSTGVDLAWSGAAPVKGYEIWRRGGTDGSTLVARVRGVHTESFRDTGLGIDASYTYRIRAFDGARVSDWSNGAEASTPLLCLS
ncbi:MAG TPA: protein kinase [Actinomycetota bacterium]|nr:protein kinase [Actinomycetota bacterium]